jgi:hypothetical protein
MGGTRSTHGGIESETGLVGKPQKKRLPRRTSIGGRII